MALEEVDRPGELSLLANDDDGEQVEVATDAAPLLVVTINEPGDGCFSIR